MIKSISRAALSFFIPFLWTILSCAQEVIRCGTHQYLQSHEEKFPGTIEKLNELQQAAQQWASDHPDAIRSTYTIPVVVHVVWHTDQENVSDSKIQSQIEVLNEDFNRRNVDTGKTPSVWKPVAGSISVRFCLAAYAPDGSDTNGITRTYTQNISFEDDRVKHNNTGGADGWTSDYYLNIWVCNLVFSSNGSDFLGYANPSPGSANDGVVIAYNAFGRGETLKSQFDEGRTATHEVGHWLSLAHTFDGGCNSSDNCYDTPPEFQEVFECPSFPFFDACSTDSPGVMFMNYMDYTNDECMNLFTRCQCNAMVGMLNTSRQALMSSPAGCAPPKFNLDASVSAIAFPDDTVTSQAVKPRVQISNYGLDEINSAEINYRVDGQPDSTYHYEGNVPSQTSILITLPEYFTGEGGHTFYAWISNPNNSIDQFIYNDTSTEEFFVRSMVPKNTTTISVQQGSPTDQPTVTILNPSSAILHLEVINILGQIIQAGNWPVISTPSFTVDLSNVPTGVYFLRGKIGYDYVKKKVMVLRK